jgi:hypothetical protein
MWHTCNSCYTSSVQDVSSVPVSPGTPHYDTKNVLPTKCQNFQEWLCLHKGTDWEAQEDVSQPLRGPVSSKEEEMRWERSGVPATLWAQCNTKTRFQGHGMPLAGFCRGRDRKGRNETKPPIMNWVKGCWHWPEVTRFHPVTRGSSRFLFIFGGGMVRFHNCPLVIGIVYIQIYVFF